MHFTDDTSAGHEADDGHHEQRARNGSETWPLSAGQAAGNAAIARSPHVSLFSPGVPAMSPTASADAGIGYARAHEGSPTPAGPSRPLSSLAAVASMTKRTSRLKLADDHTPIVQLQTQIPSVQKSGDDPTTPLDTPGKKRTTIDLVGSEYATITSLSGLFAGSPTMSNSRAPSYNQATGPLYLRGMSACGWYCRGVHTLTLHSIQRRGSSARPPLHSRSARRPTLRHLRHCIRQALQPAPPTSRPSSLLHHRPL